MTSIIITQGNDLPDLIEEGGEVRVLDLTLAERLGYERPRAIRDLIKRHQADLEAIGSLPHRAANPGPKGGRPTTAFYLTQAQALFILAKSETARANIELTYVVEVFTQYQQGNLVAKDAEAQAVLDAAEAARQARIAEMREDKAIRHDVLRMIGRGRSRKPSKGATGKARKG